jgi:ADP-heptose:LPS heptosyltransferase
VALICYCLALKHNMKPLAPEFRFKIINTIAVFRALYLGDMLSIIPTVRAIRRAYPDARITLIGLAWQRDFVKRFSAYFDDFLEFPGWPGLPEQHSDPDKILSFLHHIRDRKFDLILQMQGNGVVTNSMCMLWGAKHVAGLRREGQYCPDPDLFPVSEDDEHEVTRFFKLLDGLEIPHQGTELEFPILGQEIESFGRISHKLSLRRHKYVCVHPGARDPRRRWSSDNFAFICQHLSETGYQVVLTGAQVEALLLETLENKIDLPVKNIVKLAGDVGLGELALILKNALYVISNDTGVSHIAAALRVPSTVIFSPYSQPSRWAPLDSSLHQVVTHDLAGDPEYVLYLIMDRIQQTQKRSMVLLD